MPTYTRAPAAIPTSQIEGISSDAEAFGASLEETWQTGPTGAADMFQRLRAAESVSIGERVLNPLFGVETRQLSPLLTPAEATQKVSDAGLEGQVPLNQYPNGIRQETLQILIDANLAKVRRQTMMQQADGWAPQLGGMLVGSLVDPINVASAFIPVVGEARYAQLLSRAGGVAGRTGVRLGVGAVEGAAGAAVLEPLIYAGQQQWRNDYDAYDSLLNIAGGAGFGALLHGGAGLVKDAFGRTVDAPIRKDDFTAESISPESLAEVAITPTPDAPRIDFAEIDVPDEFIATTKGGMWRLTDKEAVAGRDFSEFGQIREVVAYDGDTPIGSLIYANDGTPPTIEVDAAYQRKGVGTAMLKLAKDRGGVLGDPRTGVAGRGVPTYRTEAGQAFRTAADETTVSIVPRRQQVEVGQLPASASGAAKLMNEASNTVRPFIAGLEPQTQASALRHALAQDAQGQPVDVTPAMLTDPRFRDDPDSYREAMRRAETNARQTAAADPQASQTATQTLADTPTMEPLAQAQELLAEAEARYKELGGEDLDFDEGDYKVTTDAVKAATLCLMRSGA